MTYELAVAKDLWITGLLVFLIVVALVWPIKWDPAFWLKDWNDRYNKRRRR